MWRVAADPMTNDNIGCSFSIHEIDRSNRLLGCRTPTSPSCLSPLAQRSPFVAASIEGPR